MIIHKVEVRNLQIEDYPKLKVAMQSAYDDMENSYWKEKCTRTITMTEGTIINDTKTI